MYLKDFAIMQDFQKSLIFCLKRLRAALGRQICLANVEDDKVLYALTLSPEWEKTLDDSCQRTELGTMFPSESDAGAGID